MTLSVFSLFLYNFNLLELISLNRLRRQFLIASAREETRLLLALDIVTPKIPFTSLPGIKQLRTMSPARSLSEVLDLSGTSALLDILFPKYMTHSKKKLAPIHI